MGMFHENDFKEPMLKVQTKPCEKYKKENDIRFMYRKICGFFFVLFVGVSI